MTHGSHCFQTKVRENFYYWVLLGNTGYYYGGVTMGILLGTTGYHWVLLGTNGAVLRQYWCSTKGSIGAVLGQY